MTAAEEDTPDAVWTAGHVARQLGIAESTLRSWHRRYRIGPDNPSARGYRRYAAEDITRLRRMRDLVQAGMLPSDAARELTRPTATTRSAAEDLTEVLAAARALDTARCVAVLGRCLERGGVLTTWEDVCRPALATVNDINDLTCLTDEHVLSFAVSSVLRRVRPPAAPPEVLLACTEAEYHTLSLEALAAALAESGTSVRMIGAATPMSSLLHAVAAVRPAAVVLWSQQHSTARRDGLTRLAGCSARLITAGPGWSTPMPAGVEHCTSLAEAVALLTVRPVSRS